MKKLFVTALLVAGMGYAAVSVPAAPKIQFDQLVYDFGKTSQVEVVTGTFKYRNTGDAPLKVDPPKPSCGCTVASLKSETLQPGESGELSFTLNLGHTRAELEKHIAVTSNDPQTPEISLTIKVDYLPLYDVTPSMLTPNLPPGGHENTNVTINRTDDKPLNITRLVASKPWITAKMASDTETNSSTGRIQITVQPDGPPRQFNEYVHVYAADEPKEPVAVIYVYGRVLGELTLMPEALYWNVPVTTNSLADSQDAVVVRRISIISAHGQKIELKNPQSTIQGITVSLTPKEDGQSYELTARLDEMPDHTVTGNVSFDTSLAGQPKVEVPLVVNVFKP